MPAIMLPKQMMLSKSKSSFGSGKGSATWGQRSSLYSTCGSVEMKMAMERRQSLERSLQSSTRSDSSLHQTSSVDAADDWGFFVDIGHENDERNERTFLNGFSTSTSNKLTTIADSRV